jgi:galactose-1-phosphate uridylyltransferase
MNHCHHQSDFDAIKNASSWEKAFDWFYQQQVDEGFVDPKKLSINTLFSQYSAEYGLDFKILINRIRDAYANQVVSSDKTPAKKYCPLCVEYIDALGQHKKQVVNLSLNQRDYVLSLTPFPSFAKHLVLSLKEHQPMFMNNKTLADLLLLQQELGDAYSIVSNSDHIKTGASILDHHHVQVLGQAYFPVADAKTLFQKIANHENGDVLIEQLHFPATVIRLSAKSNQALMAEAQKFLSDWRAIDPANTCNLWVRKNKGSYEIYFILRHPSYETNPSLFRYKTEGIGIIEMCGYGIFPTPKQDTGLILKELQDNTAELIIRLLESHAPDFPKEYFS